MTTIAIIGGRDFNNKQWLHHWMNHLLPVTSKVVSGGAKGADKMGEEWAITNNIPTEIFYPDWDKYGKRAGFIRNQLIIEASDCVVAFWDGKSAGTKSSIEIARKLNKPCMVIPY
jgi:hypothetical protein